MKKKIKVKSYKSSQYNNRISRIVWPIFVYLFIFGLAFSSIFSNFLLKNNLEVKQINQNIYRIAVIDIAFDLSEFNKIGKRKQIIAPIDIENNSTIINKSPMFDYNNNIKFDNHGTEIINILIGKNGLLPNAEIIPIKISEPIMLPKALEHAINHGAQIINISLKFNSNNRRLNFILFQSLLEASKFAFIFIAAGNDGLALESHNYGNSILNLAQASNGKIFLVAATSYNLFKIFNKQDRLASFSNYPELEENKKYVLYAPGENISLKPWYINLFNQGISGTSIAAPLAIIKYINNSK